MLIHSTLLAPAEEPFLRQHGDDLVVGLITAAAPYAIYCLYWLGRAVVARIRARHGPEAAVLGEWFVYHYSRRQGEVIFRKECWSIKLRLRGDLWITTTDEKMTSLAYAGTVSTTQSTHIICRLQGTTHHEEFYVRVLYPIPSNDEMTFGIKVGEDFDHQVFSTIYLFSRSDLSMVAARRLLTARLRQCLDVDKRALVLRH